ncbi:hypothetical protein ACET3X_008199 [Alternaria dauci]|uniref:O-methyltransferase domain-containing protein n=1 Tax=Alternaria dauci TaxID=48095 RepID=A0ABR3UAN3_9PLEO
MGFITETGSDEYKATNFSKALIIPTIGDGYPALAGGALQSVYKFPEYLEKHNYELTTDIKNGPYQYAFGTDVDMFRYFEAHPPLGQQFNNHMGGYRQDRPSWMDSNFYPVQERLIDDMDTSKDAALLVDIGGGYGHDIQEFKNKYPQVPAGERGPSILKQVAGAMKPGYSKLLVNENVIPDTGAGWQATALDMMMITLFSSKERTHTQWSRLLESPEIGLKIVRVYSVKHSQESLIECELA